MAPASFQQNTDAQAHPMAWSVLARMPTSKLLRAVGFGASSGSQSSQRTAWAEFTNQDVERIVVVPVVIPIVDTQ